MKSARWRRDADKRGRGESVVTTTWTGDDQQEERSAKEPGEFVGADEE